MPKLFPALDCLGSRELPPRAVISVVVEVAMTSLCVDRFIHKKRTGCTIMGDRCDGPVTRGAEGGAASIFFLCAWGWWRWRWRRWMFV